MSIQEANLGEEKISRLLFKLSMPALLAMLVHALYNVVDTIFIGRGVGTDAIGGLSVAFPMQMAIMAFAAMMGFGAASVVSRNLGAKEYEKANSAAGNTFLLSLVVGLLVSVVSLLTVNQIVMIFGATPELETYARDYLSIILYGTVFITIAMSMNNIIRAEGNAKIAMLTMFVGTGVNIILDPIFIFGLNWGIKGAAWATLIAQIVSCAFVLFYFGTGKSSLHIKLRHFKPHPEMIREILALGFPAFVRHAGMSIIMILANNGLKTYGGPIYISAYGISWRIMMFVFLPLFGIAQGYQPITGFNFGAKKFDRVKEVLLLSIKATSIIGVIIFILLMIFTEPVIRIFSNDPELCKVTVPVLRMIMLLLPFIGIQVIGAGFFQAIGRAIPAFFLGLSRQFILLIPLLLVFPRLFGVNGVFISFPIADLFSTILTALWVYFEMKKLIRQADSLINEDMTS